MLADHILFIDGEAIVVDKPAGLPVDPPRDGSVSVENHLQSLTYGFKRWPHPVHRLDRDTSGCLLLSRNPKAHARFGQAFEAGTVEKLYYAVLAGIPEAKEGVVDLALAKVSSKARGWRMVGDPKGKPAQTAWRVIAEENGRALVEFKPKTGRTHQIRVHAASGIGMPIYGDTVYGSGGQGALLHAASLSLPRDGKPPIEAKAPLPARFIALGFVDPYVPPKGQAYIDPLPSDEAV
jgi:tRNA pseudouridine32 synthase/23S rRNA pseudouridine746 synthase